MGYAMNQAISDNELEQECELWDWVRTAGVSAEALKVALKNFPLQEEPEERKAA